MHQTPFSQTTRVYNCYLYCFHRDDDPRKHEWFKSINFARLEAGLIDPPWVPKPNVVYAKDTGDIAEFSEIKGIEFDANDEKFFKEFGTGAVSFAWQTEMIDSGLFDELNDPNRKESAGGLDDDKKSGTCTLLWEDQSSHPVQNSPANAFSGITNMNETVLCVEEEWAVTGKRWDVSHCSIEGDTYCFSCTATWSKKQSRQTMVDWALDQSGKFFSAVPLYHVK